MFGLSKLRDAVLELAAALLGCARTAREADSRLREQLALDGPPLGEVIDAPAPALENGRRKAKAT